MLCEKPSQQDRRATSGTTPNLYWRALSQEELVANTPSFVALPDVASVRLAGVHTFRYVRQGSTQWKDLHQGVLSTGLLREALAFKEKATAKAVGCAGQAGHDGLLRCYKHLLTPFVAGSTIAAPEAGGETSSDAAACEAAIHHNVALIQLQQQARQSGCLSPAGAVTRAAPSCPTAAPAHQLPIRSTPARDAARGGLTAVRMAWGGHQEAASLFCLAQLFPQATLHEVGLCCMQADELPPCWYFRGTGATEASTHDAVAGTASSTNIAGGPLPLLGASPDAIICHHYVEARCTPQQWQDLSVLAAHSAALASASTSSALAYQTQGQHVVAALKRVLATDVPGCLVQPLAGKGPAHAPAECYGARPNIGRAAGVGSAPSSQSSSQQVLEQGQGAVCALPAGCGTLKEISAEHCAGQGGANSSTTAIGGPAMQVCEALAQLELAPAPCSTSNLGVGAPLVLAAALSAASPVLQLPPPDSVPPADGALLTGREGTLLKHNVGAAPTANTAWSRLSQHERAVQREGMQVRVLQPAETTLSPSLFSSPAAEGAPAGEADPGTDAAATAFAGLALAVGASEPASIGTAGATGTSAVVTAAAAAAVAAAAEVATAMAQAVTQGPQGRICPEVAQLPAAVAALNQACRTAQLLPGAPRSTAAAHLGTSVRVEAHLRPPPLPRMFMVREVVEVKNSVPFGLLLGWRSRRAAEAEAALAEVLGGVGTVQRKDAPRYQPQYVISDRGPRDRVEPHWVPQLQLHMLVAGTWSGLLLTRSATKGVSVFRMFRDDEYIRRMLRLVSRFYAMYVLKGVEPPHNMFSKDPEHQNFLQHTRRLACVAALVVHASGGELSAPPGSEEHAFV